jgi:putative flippase GtrA
VSAVTPDRVAPTGRAQGRHTVGTAARPTLVDVTTETAEPDLHTPQPPAGTDRVVLDVVVPVHNEETDLETCVRRLHAHLTAQVPYTFRITVADNASTDATPAIAAALAHELSAVTAFRMAEKGRGRALRAVWGASDAQVLAYCDVDLSTDLAALLPLVAPLISGHSDVAIGTRLGRGARVVRGSKREIISRCYNLLLRGTLHTGFTDAQCGFKAVRADVARRLLPLVEDTGWFFDTELLVLAERAGLRIHEVPVDWVDDPDSKVDIVATAVEDLRGIARVGRALASGTLPLAELRTQLGRAPLAPSVPGVPPAMPRQLVRFAAIGVASTVANLVLYVLFRGVTGVIAANVAAMLITTVLNTAANRRLTFGVHGRDGAARHQLQGLVVFALGLGLTTGALALLGHAVPDAGRTVELAVIVLANAVATVLRFVLFRSWVFRTRPAPVLETPA